jgi:hypothetical protein
MAVRLLACAPDLYVVPFHTNSRPLDIDQG